MISARLDMSYRRILVPFDGSELSYKAVKHALCLAEKFSAVIFIVSILSSSSISNSFLNLNSHETIIERAKLKSIEKKHLDLVNLGKKNNLHIITKTIISTQIAQSILSCIYSTKSDLVIIGTRGNGTDRKLMLGSVSLMISQNSPIPVLLTK